jgi:hydroxymethylbilane synthase
MSELVIGSRGSKLALWQANHIAAQLQAKGHTTRIEIIQTTGDKITDVALSKVGTKGLFTKEIEEALLVLSAFPERQDPRDAIIGDMPENAIVGTSSLRRAAQLKTARPDIDIRDLRGNVDTRLRKQAGGQYNAILLAAAGLIRLGWQDRITEYLDPAEFVPAVGQGALAIETRADGGIGHTIVAQMDDPETRARLTAERAALKALGGGCQVPMGAHAILDQGTLKIHGIVISQDGRYTIRAKSEGPANDAENIGATLGQFLLDAGARL